MEIHAYGKNKRHTLIYRLESQPYIWCSIKWTEYRWTLIANTDDYVDTSGYFKLCYIDNDIHRPFFKFYLNKYSYFYSILYEILLIIFLPFICLIPGLIFSIEIGKMMVGRLSAWASKIFGSLITKREKHIL